MDKANYRTELDALNALVDEQRKANTLLEKLTEQKEEKSDASSDRRETTVTRQRGNRRGGNLAK